MTIINPIVSIVFYIIMDICCLLFMIATILSFDKAKSMFICKQCKGLNKIIYKRCTYCNKPMKQWIGIFITFYRKRRNCCNKEGYPDYNKTKRVILEDAILIIILTLIFSIGLARNIIKLM